MFLIFQNLIKFFHRLVFSQFLIIIVSLCTSDGICKHISDFSIFLFMFQLGCRSFVEKAYPFVFFDF